jgi:hypothetical protein
MDFFRFRPKHDSNQSVFSQMGAFYIRRRRDSCSMDNPLVKITGRDCLESLAGIKWNGWPEWNGIGCQDRPECAKHPGSIARK